MKDNKGSVTIETSITFSIVLVFIVSIINVAAVYRADILMQRAVEQTCEDFSLFPPLSITVSDTLSTVVNALPDEVSRTDAMNTIEQIARVSIGADLAAEGQLSLTVSELLLAPRFEADILAGYIERNNGSEFFMPDMICVELDYESGSDYLGLNVSYSIDTITGPVDRNIYSVIPLYGEWDLFFNGSHEEEEDDDVWSLSNFERGRSIGEMYGANLPDTFPVIDRVDGDTVTSITSIDLTSPYYSNSSRIDRIISEDISRLADFNGMETVIDGVSYVVPPEASAKKEYVVVIPSNTPEETVEYLSGWISEAYSNGINMRIEQHGDSQRYS